MTKKAATAARKTTPPTAPAIMGIKFVELPGGDGVDEGGGVVRFCWPGNVFGVEAAGEVSVGAAGVGVA